MKKKFNSSFRWVVAAIFFLAYMIAGADRANIGVVVPFVQKEFALSNTDIGSLASLFYLVYAAIQIPAGWLYSKFGIRRLMTASLIMTSFATLLIGFTTSALQLKWARALLGAAEGPINIGIVSIINRWFPSRERGLATAIFFSAMKFAPAFVPPLCAVIIHFYGWREVFYIFAIPGIFIAVIWWWLVKDEPSESKYCGAEEIAYISEENKSTDVAENKEKVKSFKTLDVLIRSRQVELLDNNVDILKSWSLWGCALAFACMVGITYAIMTWIPTYLIDVKKYSVIKMGVLASAPWVGAILGALLGGWLTDRVFDKRRKPNLFITTISTILMMAAFLNAPNDPYLLAGLFLLAGIMLNIGFSTFLVYPMGLTVKRKVPFAASIVSTCGSLGGAFGPYIVGVILDHYSWNYVFLFLAVLSCFSFLILLTIIEPMSRAKLDPDTVSKSWLDGRIHSSTPNQREPGVSHS